MNLQSTPTNLVVCPYDANHKMLPNRLAIHLIKCAKQHAGRGMIRCPFNSNHVLKATDMESHVENCECRIDPAQYEFTVDVVPQKPQPPTLNMMECSENWDDEPPSGTYNPMEYCKKHLISLRLQNASRK